MILAIAKLWYPDYEVQHWQQWLIYVLLIWLAIGLNVFGHSLIPKFNQMIGRSTCPNMRFLLTSCSCFIRSDYYWNHNYALRLRTRLSRKWFLDLQRHDKLHGLVQRWVCICTQH